MRSFGCFQPWSSGYPLNWDAWRHWTYQRAGHRCQMCGQWNVKLHAHHIVPVSQGGGTSPENLAAVCESCHTRIHPHMQRRASVYPSYSMRPTSYAHYPYAPIQYAPDNRRIYQSLSNTERLVLGPFAPEYYGGIAKIMSQTSYPNSETAAAISQQQQTWNPAYSNSWNSPWNPNNSVWGMNPFNSFMWAKMFPGQLPLGGIFGQAMAGHLL